MGIWSSSRKRGHGDSGRFDGEDDYVSKKRKFLFPPVPTDGRASLKIFQYPDIKSGFRRRLHAPVRNSRFLHSYEKPIVTIGNSKDLFLRYQHAKEEALGSLRTMEKDFVNRIEGQDDDVPDEFSIGTIGVVEHGEDKRTQGQVVAESSHEDRNAIVIDKMASFDSSIVIDEVYLNAKEDVTNGMEAEQLGHMSKEDVTNDIEAAQLGHMSDSKVPLHKIMLEKIRNESDKKLNLLDSLIKSILRRVQSINLLRNSKKEESNKNLKAEYFTPLTEEEENEISDAMSNRSRRKILVAHESSNIDITGELLQCLGNGAWLNDEVINLYLALLKEREKREPPGKFLKCHFFNTFFYKKLISGKDGYNFQSVRRWTTQKKLGYSLLECEKIFVPIHKEIHWCLAIINKKEETFQYLDSLGGCDPKALNVLARYFVDEVKDKSAQEIDVSSWKREFVEDLPHQENGFDCGVFMIKYADFCSRDIGLCFSQHHMPYFRRRTAKEILKLRAE